MNCLECQEQLQRRLDGESVEAGGAFDQHLAACPACRELALAVQRLQEGLRLLRPPVPPPYLAARIADRLLARRRRIQYVRGVCALAASLLAAVLAGYYGLRARPSKPPPAAMAQAEVPTIPLPAPSVQESMEEVSSAVVSLTRRTADETMGQTRFLWTEVVSNSFRSDTGVLTDTLEPSAQSLREAGLGVSAGLEPVATSARRAMSLFLRDVPPMEPARPSGL